MFAVARHHFYAHQTGVDALDTAAWTVVHAFFGRHFGQAVLTTDETNLAGFDTGNVLNVHFWLDFD